ncbi:hypothetical protein HDU97_007183 [Phlyctochytrium planicorne]|nr:hypothetical protein HDU97_007183 [Phlyctochytrium planicorne]
MSLGLLSQLPKELHIPILKLTGEWKTSIVVEAINAGLPHRFEDAGKAIDEVDVESMFPAAYFLLKDSPKRGNLNESAADIINLSLLQFAFVLKCGAHPLLETFVRVNKRPSPGAALAGLNPTVKILRFQHSKEPLLPSFEYLIVSAASGGHLDSLKFLDSTLSPSFTLSHIARAASNGHLHVIEWLHEKIICGIPEIKAPPSFLQFGMGPDHAMNHAARNGHLSVVQWLHINRTEGCSEHAMDGGAQNGHLEVVKWLHENRTEGCSKRAMDGAAENGHLEIVKWLHENRSEGCSVKAMDGAAQNGHLEVVKWLHEKRLEGCTVKAMDSAAGNGHLEIVQWLHENRTEGCSRNAMDKAAWKSHWKIVKWLHVNRSEGHCIEAMDQLATGINMEMLTWVHENTTDGCPSYALFEAVRCGNTDVVKWLLENRAEGLRKIEWSIQKALDSGHEEIADILKERVWELEQEELDQEY